MKTIKIKFTWRGKRKVWYPLQTLTVVIILMLAINIFTSVTNKPKTNGITEHYVSKGETLWDIYCNEYQDVNILWDKFSYQIKNLNGKKTFNEGEIILLPIYNK